MKYVTLNKWFGRLVIMALVLCMVISMTACGKNTDGDSGSGQNSSSATEATVETTEATEGAEVTTPVETTAAPEATTETVPSATVETTPAKDYVTMYTTILVNYRKGPGTSYAKIGSLPKGSTVQVAEGSKTDNGWYEVLIDGTESYMYAGYLSLTPPSTENTAGPSSPDNSSTSTNAAVSSTEPTEPSSTAGSNTEPTVAPSSPTGSNTESDNASAPAETTGTFVAPANTDTGISWDGVSPIIYTYADGSTGTTPVDGATYERAPGVTSTYREYKSSVDEYYVDGKFICYLCGKVQGNGSDGTCLRYLMFGDTCSCCGEYVEKQVCHTCDEE